MKYLVSSCLAGVACRYNGTASLDEKIQELVEQEQAKMVCPSCLVDSPLHGNRLKLSVARARTYWQALQK